MIDRLQTATPAFLHHLHISSENPAALATFYQTQFSLESIDKTEDRYVLLGGARSVIISKGLPASLACAGFALRNSDDVLVLRKKIAAEGLSPLDADNPLYQPGAFEVFDPQGRRVSFGVPRHLRSTDPAPARLQHTVFQTTQLEQVVKFYTEKIGFTISDEVVDDDGRIMVVFMRSDDEHHSMAFFRGSKNEWDHHCYETNEWNDIRDWGDKFAKQRIPIFFGPGRHGPGNNLFFMVTDPDGNRLEFSAELQLVDADTLPGVWPHGEYTLNSWGRAWIRS